MRTNNHQKTSEKDGIILKHFHQQQVIYVRKHSPCVCWMTQEQLEFRLHPHLERISWQLLYTLTRRLSLGFELGNKGTTLETALGSAGSRSNMHK